MSVEARVLLPSGVAEIVSCPSLPGHGKAAILFTFPVLAVDSLVVGDGRGRSPREQLAWEESSLVDGVASLRIGNVTSDRVRVGRVMVCDITDGGIVLCSGVGTWLAPGEAADVQLEAVRGRAYDVYVDGVMLARRYEPTFVHRGTPGQTRTAKAGARDMHNGSSDKRGNGRKASAASGGQGRKKGGLRRPMVVAALVALVLVVYGASAYESIGGTDPSPVDMGSKPTEEESTDTVSEENKDKTVEDNQEKQSRKQDGGSKTERYPDDARGGAAETGRTLAFDGNGADNGTTNSLELGPDEKEVTLPECGFTRSGCHFGGWDVAGSVYQAGEVISVEDLPADGAIRATWKFSAASLDGILSSRFIETSGNLRIEGQDGGSVPMTMCIATNVGKQTVDISLENGGGIEGEGGSVSLRLGKTYQRALAPGESTWLIGMHNDGAAPTLAATPVDERFAQSIISATKVEEAERSAERVSYRITNKSSSKVSLSQQWLLVEPDSESLGFQSASEVRDESGNDSGFTSLESGESATVTFVQQGADWTGKDLWYCPSGAVVGQA